MQDKEICDIARDVFQRESATIDALIGRVLSNIADAHRLIVDTTKHGRLVCSGMGKAGIIATKASATFASIGCSSFFLHPAEALHGDLGRLRGTDCALLFSYSGETEEVCRLLPELRRLGSSIIAITANTQSTLGSEADVCLSIGEIEEVGPLGLAPTSTTIAMLAVADALAMTYLKENNTSLEDFARLHPGGSLGRRLTRIKDIMRIGARHCVVHEQQAVRTVLKAISETEGRPGAATIINAEGKLIGIFTDGDLRRLLASSEDFLDKPVSLFMGKSPRTITENELLGEAANVFGQAQVDQLIVIDHLGLPVGLLDIQDILSVRN